MIPRWMHRLYAQWNHYFWLPCDVCGREFGGHESARDWNHIQDPDNPGSGMMVCRKQCVEKYKTMSTDEQRKVFARSR